jgi:hypothetical protein
LTETLTDVELDLIHFVERFHASTGSAPTDAQINARYDLDKKTLKTFKQNPLVLKSFDRRGIIYPPAEDRFTPEQMHAAAVMTDMIDRRSDEKKLRDLGITTRQWSSWVQDESFAAYLRDRSERLLENSVFEAHKGLMKGVRNGNVASVKTFYEVTGRYRPNEEAQIDIRHVLHTFIEVIQKFVKDPVTLHAIAMELSQVASAESLSTGLTNQMMSGAQSFRTRTISGELDLKAPSLEMVNDE